MSKKVLEGCYIGLKIVKIDENNKTISNNLQDYSIADINADICWSRSLFTSKFLKLISKHSS